MKTAISGYWNICKEDGIITALQSFYVYYYTKYKIKKKRKENNFTIKTHECVIDVNPNDDGISTELLVFGHHEPKTTKFVSSYLKTGMICLDVGANIGYYSTLYSKKIGEDGKVLSIEPSPINFKYLNLNLEKQNMNNFTTFNCACGDIEGEIEFCLDSRANKCFIPTTNDALPPNHELIKVPIRTIDSIVTETEIKKIDFVKMDVEGYEWQTLQGAINSIKKFKPTIQIEIHFNRIGHEKTIKILKFFEYEKYKIIYVNEELQKQLTKNISINVLIEYFSDKKKHDGFKLILEHV